jgi:predicted nucleic acid-binding protein
MDEPRIVEAADLAIRYRLRTMDAIHLACALSLGAAGDTTTVSADIELLAAAVQEGLSTINPSLP